MAHSTSLRRLTLATVVAGLLALPAAAHAVDIGSGNLDMSPDGTLGCTDATSSCIQAQDEIDGDESVNVVPPQGRIITRFRFRAATNAVALRILRPTALGLERVGGTVDAQGSALDEVQSFTTHIPVQPGDYIGLKLGPGASFGALEADPGTNVFEFTDADAPQLIDGDGPYELQLDARVEPDRDGDGQGDLTEDPDRGSPRPDPLAALREGKRPTARILGKRFEASKRRVVRMKISNPNSFKLKGNLRLTAKGLKLGTESFSVRGKGRKTVAIKLSRKGFRALERRRTLNAVARATVRGPIGKAGTVKKSIRIKAPPQPKPERRSGGGGGGGGGTNPCGSPVFDPCTGRMQWCPGLYGYPSPYCSGASSLMSTSMPLMPTSLRLLARNCSGGRLAARHAAKS